MWPWLSSPAYYVVPVFPPTISGQQKVVAKPDEPAGETKRLEATYQQKLSALDELKQSLLHKAFNSELIAA